MGPKYLTNAELIKKLERIEEVALRLEKAIEENNIAHENFRKEFVDLLEKEDKEIHDLKRKFTSLYKKYFAAKTLFDSE